MSWFRLDDSFHSHPKVIAAGNAAVGLFTRCGTWCADHLTDGHIPKHIASFYGTSREISTLVSVCLWKTEEGGYVMDDYLDYNPSRDEIETERARRSGAKARAGRLGGIASGVARRKHERSTTEAEHEAEYEANAKQNEAPTRPDPYPLVVKTDDDYKSVAVWPWSSSTDFAKQTAGRAAELLAIEQGKGRGWTVATAKNLRTERADRIVEAILRGLSVELAAEYILTDPTPAKPAGPTFDPGCPLCAGSGWTTIVEGCNDVKPCDCAATLAPVIELRRIL